MPPIDYEVDRPIDDQGHTAIHWATAMGDITVVKAFIDLNADIGARNVRGETPLIRAVHFVNNQDKGTMGQLSDLLKDSFCYQDSYGGTVLHHAAATTSNQSRKRAARHYLEVLLHKMSQVLPRQVYHDLVNAKDQNGNTALHIVAQNQAKKCVRVLLGRGSISDIPNDKGETADEYLRQWGTQPPNDYALMSSSPIQPGMRMTNGHAPNGVAIADTSPPFGSQAARSFNESFGNLASGKGLQVAIAMESELRDKETDLEEASRLLSNVENERSTIRARTFTLISGGEPNELGDDAELTESRLEYDGLKAVAESYLEQQQHKELDAEVREEDAKLPPSAHHGQMNGASMNDIALQEKLQLAWELAAEQERRRQLVRSVVEAQATAGMTEKGEALKSMIAKIIDVSNDEVVDLVPELLEELELSKMDGMSRSIEPAAFAI